MRMWCAKNLLTFGVLNFFQDFLDHCDFRGWRSKSQLCSDPVPGITKSPKGTRPGRSLSFTAKGLRDGYPSTVSPHSCSPTAGWHVRHRRYINSVPLSSAAPTAPARRKLRSLPLGIVRCASIFLLSTSFESRLVINDITLND